jgi:hypothetical protein
MVMYTPRCKKKKFRDEIAAKLVLARIQRIDNPKRETDERRVYLHQGCGWHLTSQALARV